MSLILHDQCSQRNPSFCDLTHDHGVITWPALRDELAKNPAAIGREAAWLAEQLGIGVQAVHNWSDRGVPARQAVRIARLLHWSVARVMGSEDPPARWPLRRITRERWESLDDWDRGAIEAAAVRALEDIEAQRASDKRRSAG